MLVITFELGVRSLYTGFGMGFFFLGMKVTWSTYALAIFTSGMVGLLSALFPAYHAARIDIVEGLRHIG